MSRLVQLEGTNPPIPYLHVEHPMGYIPPTKNGYQFAEVTSAMQKAVRRGHTDAAVFWALELEDSGYGEYVWKRLRIICTEDVGLAVPGAAADVRALYENWKQQDQKRDKSNSQILFLIHAVMLLAEAPKSRAVDWMLIAQLNERRLGQMRQVPDEALDKHTVRGKRMGRSWEHFFSDSSTLENHEPTDDEDALKKRAWVALMAYEKRDQLPLDAPHGSHDPDVDTEPGQETLI